jgi:hypothetical protein
MRFSVQREGAAHLARSIDAAIVTELTYGCNCRSANGNTATGRQSVFFRRNGGNSMPAPVASEIPTSVRMIRSPSLLQLESNGVAASLGWPPIVKLCWIHSVADPAAHLVHHLLLTPAGVMNANRFDFELANVSRELQRAH